MIGSVATLFTVIAIKPFLDARYEAAWVRLKAVFHLILLSEF